MKDQDYWEITVRWKDSYEDPRARAVVEQTRPLLEESNLPGALEGVSVSDVFYLRGPGLSGEVLAPAVRSLLCDPVTQAAAVRAPRGGAGIGGEVPPASRSAGVAVATVQKKTGVMDPVEASLLQGLADLGIEGVDVRTATQYELRGVLGEAERRLLAEKVLSNPAIEEVRWDVRWAEPGAAPPPPPAPFSDPPDYVFSRREVPLAGLDDAALLEVSRRGQLSLSLEEMEVIRGYFEGLGRAPSDVELETIAQTWSEHCCHKTLTGRILHVREHEETGEREEIRYESLLRETIRRATETIAAPWCLSVFVDNAGAIAFDEEHAVTFKVETHNHPSAIEPYGGAGTGIGGVLRDTLGTGLGAKPIVNTDVFCFGPPDLPLREVPQGALHPLRALRGVVAGVRDYGNRMGIPTASGALYFDRRYVGNPLVFCGSVGILPRDALEKSVRPGDRVYVLGGRTGRDGIHGATFSSVELTQESETISSGAVQIGNAITEKKVLDVLLQARDRRLYRGVTDCGAGGLSSAVGEMGAETGARVELSRVPLKYHGLSYWEIWISEAQERMVLAVPPESAAALEALARSEDVECTDIGQFTGDGVLTLTYEGVEVCAMAMSFLHDGRPRTERRSLHRVRRPRPVEWPEPPPLGKELKALLGSWNIASKEWVIRQYDHEVQGRSILKPLQGVGEDGPGDGVAFAPRFGSRRGIVLGCGMSPTYGDLDPYNMAASAIDEAVRNVVAAGGDPDHTAILDNFCWGNTERPETLGSLVEASRGCLDAALALGVPFISGKDSLNNEYRVDGEVISIPPTLLISAISVVEDVGRLVSMDLKAPGNRLVLVGLTRGELGGSHYARRLGLEGGAVPALEGAVALRLHRAVAEAIGRGWVESCHDLSEGGLGVAIAEMAFAGGVGAEIGLARVPRAGVDRDDLILFSESCSRYLLEVRPDRLEPLLELLAGLPVGVVGETVRYGILRILGLEGEPVVAEALEDLKESWKRPLDLDRREGGARER